MELDEALIAVIKNGIFEDLEDGLKIEEFCKNLKERSETLGIDYYTLLKLTLDKDYLFLKVYDEVDKLDDEIKKIEQQLSMLESKRGELTSLICQLHGHTFDLKACEHMQFCRVCGRTIHLPDGTLPYSQRKYKLEKRFYEK